MRACYFCSGPDFVLPIFVLHSVLIWANIFKGYLGPWCEHFEGNCPKGLPYFNPWSYHYAMIRHVCISRTRRICFLEIQNFISVLRDPIFSENSDSIFSENSDSVFSENSEVKSVNKVLASISSFQPQHFQKSRLPFFILLETKEENKTLQGKRKTVIFCNLTSSHLKQ